MKAINRWIPGILAIGAAAWPGLNAQAGTIASPFMISPPPAAGAFASGYVAASPSGNFLVNSNSNGGAFLERFDSNGAMLSSTTSPAGGWGNSDKLGNVPFTSFSLHNYYLSVLSGANTVTVNQVLVNDASSPLFNAYGAVPNASGQTAVAWWTAPNGTGPATEVFLREFNNSGTALCTTPTLAAAATGSQRLGNFTMAVDGNGVTHVIYSIYTPNSSLPYSRVPHTLYYRRFSSSCAPLGSAVQVNTQASYDIEAMAIGADTLGNVVVGWEYYNLSHDFFDTYVQRYSPAGAAVGGNILVNNQAADTSMLPAQALVLGVMDGGAFAVAYGEPRPGRPTNTTNNEATWDITVAEYDASGNRIGNPFTVSDLGYGAEFPSLAMDPSGDYWVSWQKNDPLPIMYTSSAWAVRCRHPSQPAVTALGNGVAVNGLSGAAATMSYYKIVVPAGAANLALSLTGSASATMYMRLGGLPATSLYDVRQPGSAGTVTANIVNPPSGTYFIGVYGNSSYGGVSLKASY